MFDRFHHERRVGIVVALGATLILGGGRLAEWWWLGPTEVASFERVVRAIEDSFGEAARSLEAAATDVARNRVVSVTLDEPGSPSGLFDVVRDAVAGTSSPDVAMTIHGADGAPRAWAGRPSEIRVPRLTLEPTFLVTTAGRDLRLVSLAPVPDSEGAVGPRGHGTVVAERVLSPPGGVTTMASDAFSLPTPIVDVTVRLPSEASESHPYGFALRSPTGEVLLDASVAPADLVAARTAWRRGVVAIALAFLAGGLLVGVRPLLSRPRRGVSRRDIGLRAGSAATGVALAYLLLLGAARFAPWSGSALAATTYRSPRFPDVLGSPVDVVLLGLLLVAICLVAIFIVEQARLVLPASRWRLATLVSSRFIVYQLAAAVAAATLLLGLDAFMADAFEGATVDLLNTSIEPWDPGRLTLLAGVVLVSVAVVWGSVLVLVALRLPWGRRVQRTGPTLLTATLWTAPVLVMTVAGLLPALPALCLAGGAMTAAIGVPFVRPRVRHASHAVRTFALFSAFVAPALLTYPLLLHHGDTSTRDAVENRYAMEAARHPEELQTLLARALDDVDAIVARPETRRDTQAGAGPDADRAFDIWRQTEMARRRLTSAVELYRRDGGLLSRFALNYPEYTNRPFERVVSECEWDVFGEIARFGSDERRVLHAERALCERADTDRTGAAGAVVVHVASDYQTLSFIPSDNPYTELLQPSGVDEGRDPVRRSAELAVYGWGRGQLFASAQEAWSIDDVLFARIYASREPFWTTLTKGGQRYSTYVANNRVGIYAVGYPVFGTFDHLVHLAELATFAALLFVLLGLATAIASWPTPDRYRFGRELLREVRTSFYRRLFLAFVAATMVPVLALGFVMRNYFVTQLRADVEAGAARTAAVAQRVIEESQDPTALVSDDLMVWMSQVLDQEINIFQGARLAATSERDLFASGLLPTRTPDAVYTAILLERQPSHVMEDTTGSLAYLVAATPIPSVGPDAVLTVPLASRQQEIERQIEDLDRGILLGVVLFVLLGAGGGLYMAERIADPVKRLTRATGQIARGEFDAHVAARSADELQQLVVSFNRMAEDLKTQQAQLEKTHRLEAWAEMARQVAHEIKNPLTPVQLSAEHLLRVHSDQGEPLGPVLESCVQSILTQVRLLRQISAEFSSYASSPTVVRQPTSLDHLVRSILDPYLVGLESRIQVTVSVPPTLPDLSLDRTLVGRALTNIIENALHAMPGTGTLEIRGDLRDEAVVLSVVDTGVGLDQETLGRIFEPYFSTRVSGTGLGMAIAKRNVELSDGAIEVTSRKGHGTTVELRFPRPPEPAV